MEAAARFPSARWCNKKETFDRASGATPQKLGNLRRRESELPPGWCRQRRQGLGEGKSAGCLRAKSFQKRGRNPSNAKFL